MKQITVVVILLTMIPLIASIGITPALPFAEGAERLRGVDLAKRDFVCREGQVRVFNFNANNNICTSYSTAQMWENYGIAKIIDEDSIVSEDSESEPIQAPKSLLERQLDKIIEKFERGERISRGEIQTVKKAIKEQYSEQTKKDVYQELPSKLKGAQGSSATHSFGNIASGTFTSIQEPGIGHERHQLATLLPPSENIYVGKFTFSASEPVQYVALHGPIDETDMGGQPIWSPDGETNFALTMIDNGLSSGGWYFAGNALALHSMHDTPFTATYNVVYAEVPPGVYPKGTVDSGTVTSTIDPGVGHETHSLALILPLRDIPYQGGVLAYSASENVQIVVLNGPLAEEEILGQPIWSPDGKIKYALTFVDTGKKMGIWTTFNGNGLGLHTMNPDGFTASYTIAGLH